MRRGNVINNFEIFKFEPVNLIGNIVDHQFWQSRWLAAKLGVGLFKMIGIQVPIAKRMYKFTCLQPTNGGDHMR